MNLARTIISLLATCSWTLCAAGPIQYLPDELAVQLAPISPEFARVPLPGVVVRRIPELGVSIIRVGEPGKIDDVLSTLSKRADVVYAERIAIKERLWTPNDANFASQYALAKIQAQAAWDLTLGNPNVIVGVIDDGIDLTHEDLVSKLVPGRDISNDDSDPSHETGGSHGTHTAGIVGADTNNSVGVASIGNQVRVMPIKIFPNATDAVSAEAMVYAVDHGCKVLSMSYGSAFLSMTEQAGVDYAWSRGAVLIAAAGNAGSQSKFYPAAYGNVVAVAATNSADQRSGYSNYGYWVQVAAPGDNVLSTLPGGYGLLSGTSMACPLVSGTVALMWSVAPLGTSNAQIVQRLESTCDNVGSFVQYGRINAYKAVRASALVRSQLQPNLAIQMLGFNSSGTAAALANLDGVCYNSTTQLTPIGQAAIVDLTFPAPPSLTNIELFQIDAASMGDRAASVQYWLKQNGGAFTYLGAMAVDSVPTQRTITSHVTNLTGYVSAGKLVVRARITRPILGPTKPNPFNWGLDFIQVTVGVAP